MWQHLKCETEAQWQNICTRGLYVVQNANWNKTNWLWSSAEGSHNEMLAAFLCSWYPMNKLGLLNRKIGIWKTLGANLYPLLDYSDNLFKLSRNTAADSKASGWKILVLNNSGKRWNIIHLNWRISALLSIYSSIFKPKKKKIWNNSLLYFF